MQQSTRENNIFCSYIQYHFYFRNPLPTFCIGVGLRLIFITAELSWSLYGNRDIKVLGKSDLHSAAILGTMLNFLSKILISSTLVYIIFQ